MCPIPFLFANGGYANTPIENLLPVKLGVSRLTPHLGRFKPELTDVGRFHPMTRLTPVPEENEKTWAGLPALSGMNAIAGLQPGATVLLAHPTLEIDASVVPCPAPVGRFSIARRTVKDIASRKGKVAFAERGSPFPRRRARTI